MSRVGVPPGSCWPFGPRSHDVGWAWMFDLAVVGSMLGARPGDRVLDLGAGTGFATEVLARFGYRVVSLDPEVIPLRTGLGRLDLDVRLGDARAWACQGLAQALPFRDGCFRGVVGLNVLHHVDDLPGALAELARVLEPGGRAAFSEPGLRHLESAETVRVMRERGEDDKPFDVRKVAELGYRLGFHRCELRPLPYPSLNPVELRELERFAAGTHPVPWTRPEVLADYLVEYHPLFVLEKEGEAPRTSRRPGRLEAALVVGPTPAQCGAGEAFEVEVSARNLGDARWLAGTPEDYGSVSFAVKLLREDGRLVEDRLGRTPLGADVEAGGEAAARMAIALPEDLPPGRYLLAFDMVVEWVRWFGDDRVDPPATRGLEVTGVRGPAGAAAGG